MILLESGLILNIWILSTVFVWSLLHSTKKVGKVSGIVKDRLQSLPWLLTPSLALLLIDILLHGIYSDQIRFVGYTIAYALFLVMISLLGDPLIIYKSRKVS